MPTETAPEVPAPVKTADLSNLWGLFFKQGLNPRAHIVFSFNGSKEDAIKRGREFCLRMNYKFIHVEPFLVDLDETEKKFNNPVPVIRRG